MKFNTIEEAIEDIKKGRAEKFDSVEDAVGWLEK